MDEDVLALLAIVSPLLAGGLGSLAGVAWCAWQARRRPSGPRYDEDEGRALVAAWSASRDAVAGHRLELSFHGPERRVLVRVHPRVEGGLAPACAELRLTASRWEAVAWPARFASATWALGRAHPAPARDARDLRWREEELTLLVEPSALCADEVVALAVDVLLCAAPGRLLGLPRRGGGSGRPLGLPA